MVRKSLTMSSSLKNWRRLVPLYILVLVLSSMSLNAQWDLDTLHVSFPLNLDKPLKPGLSIRVYDSRDEAPNVIGMYEKNKFYLIPVDLQIRLPSPLSESIQDIFPNPTPGKDSSTILMIQDFQVTVKSSSLLYPRYQLNAALKGYQKIHEGSTYMGEWVYEATSRKPIFGGGL